MGGYALRFDAIALVLLFVAALVYGAIFSVNKLAADIGWPPFAFACLQSLISGAALLLVELARGRGFALSRRHIVSYLVIGALVIGLPISLLTWIAPHLPAGAMTLVLALSPSLTFVFACLARLDSFRWRGLFGIAAGFAGVLLLISPDSALARGGLIGWFLLALLAPVCFALSNVLASLLRPPATSSTGMAAGILLGSGVVLLPALAVVAEAPWPAAAVLDAAKPLLYATAINAIFFVCFFEIIRRAGPTFFSQFNYLAVLSGVAWGAALFGEAPDLLFWGALALMLLGIWITLSGRAPRAELKSPARTPKPQA